MCALWTFVLYRQSPTCSRGSCNSPLRVCTSSSYSFNFNSYDPSPVKSTHAKGSASCQVYVRFPKSLNQSRGHSRVGMRHTSTQRLVLLRYCRNSYANKWFQHIQVASRVRCCINIPKDQLSHSGQHVHSTAPTIFHYCETRCPYCHYYCTQPLGANICSHCHNMLA